MRWFNKILNLFSRPPVLVPPPVKEMEEDNSDLWGIKKDSAYFDRLASVNARVFQRTDKDFKVVVRGAAMDSGNVSNGSKFGIFANTLPIGIIEWFAAQSFIGYQTCAFIAQHWLVDKACLMPGRDAIRKGFDLTVNDGVEIEPEILDKLRKLDTTYKINKHLLEFVKMSRVFGIRIALFKVESNDPDYYLKPFNPDGVMPGSYKGISQIDPYWITPELGERSVSDPTAVDFYEPTWWRVNGQRIHRTHLVIARTSQVSDVLKPTYFYGGVSIPQKICERVYAAERVANEAPELTLTKRTTALHVEDVEAALLNQQNFENKIQSWVNYRNNYGIKILGIDEKLEQIDTSLADLDAVIMTQYQLVAAAANVPAVKLLGTSPKGFNATGAHEEASYHEELESIQTHDLTPFLERHYLLLVRSEIVSGYGIAPFTVTPAWKSPDSPTAKEIAEINKLKTDNGQVLQMSGVVSAEEERARIIADPNSGYSGLPDEMAIDEEENLLLQDLEANEENPAY